MKLVVKQENLKNSLNLCSHFVSPKSQLPILGNILLKADKQKLNLSSTNLETSVSTSIGAQIEKTGEITIPGKVITDIVSNLSPGQVSLELDKETLTIESGSFKSSITGVNSSDFPKIPSKLSGKYIVNLDRENFISSLSKCQFAVSVDESRPVLTGVLFLFKGNSINLVATDGFRLSQVSLKHKEKIDLEKTIVPKAVLSEVLKAENGDQIQFSFNKDDNQVLFKVGESVFSSRVIEGDFPDFEKIIPASSIYKVSVDKHELAQAVRLASVFSREAGNILKLKVSKDKVTVTAESSNSGSQKTDVEAKIETDEGKIDLEIAYNYKFIEDFLKAVEGDNIEIELISPDKPGKFLDPKNTNFLHLIMPIKVQG